MRRTKLGVGKRGRRIADRSSGPTGIYMYQTC